MKRKITIIVLSIVVVLPVSGQSTLDKAYHHKAGTYHDDKGVPKQEENPLHVELGSLVIYFKGDSVMNTLPNRFKKQGKTTHTFFMPKAEAKGSVLKKINAVDENMYQVKVESVKLPIEGIKLHVTYDPKEVSFKYEHFESIKAQKGVVFRFYNKKLINLIRKKGKVMALMAHNTRMPRVVVDCGHGGWDAGAVGSVAKEKDVCMAVGKYLAHYLRKNGCQVTLTRARDVHVPLDVRTTYANKHKDAALLVSLHANASDDNRISGIETFYVDKSLFVSGDKKICCPISHVGTAVTHTHYKQGQLLASCVHRSLIGHAKKVNTCVVDRNIKKAASQVLMGTSMPSTLVELGFISNHKEEKLLNSKQYQAVLARGIGVGIIAYINRIKSV